MRATASLLLRLVCSIALMFAALPIRAGVVCVEGGRVVGTCSMASIPEQAAPKPEPQVSVKTRMACCQARAAKKPSVRPADACPTHKNTRCAYAYRSGIAAVSTSKAPHVDLSPLPVAAILPPVLVGISFEILVGTGGYAFASDSDPPRSRPRSPDRGRAPPVV